MQNNDCVGDPNFTLPRLYADTVPFVVDATWDFPSWTPQAVVITLNTNDYNMADGCDVPADANFVAAWVDFMGVVRGHYPGAYLLYTVGPEVSAPNRARARANVQAAVARVVDAGDANIGYVALAPDTGALGYGCAGHPNQATHAATAVTITQALADALGW